MLPLFLALALTQAPPLQKPRPALSVLPAGGGSAYLVSDLCGMVATPLVGLRPDGGSCGSLALTAYPTDGGGPISTSRTQVPCGPNGCVVPLLRLDGGTLEQYRSAATASPTGDVSCAIAFSTQSAATSSLVAKFNNLPALHLYASGGVSAIVVYNGAGTTATVQSAAGAITTGSPHVVGFSYHYVADTTSTLRLYVDGSASGTPSTTAVGPLRAGVSDPWEISGRTLGLATLLTGDIYSAVCSEAEWSAATHLSLARAALGTQAGSYGETITTTRAGTLWCEADDADGTLTPLPANRNCVVRGALWVQPALTNALASGTARNWTAGVTLTNATAALTATGKDGVPKSATTLTATAPNATACQTVTIAAAARTTSLYVRRVTGTGAVSLARDGATYYALNRGNCYAASGTSAAIGSAWVRCQLTSSQLNPQICLKLATSGDVVAVDFAQDVAGEMAGAPSLAQATTAAVVTSVVKPAALTDTEGCVSARVYVPPGYTTGEMGIVGVNYAAGNLPLYIAGMDSARNYDGLTVAAQVGATLAGRWTTFESRWNSAAGKKSVEFDGASTESAYDGTIVGTPLYLGRDDASTLGLTGYIGDVKASGSKWGCGGTYPLEPWVLGLGDSMSGPSLGHWPDYTVVDAQHRVMAGGVPGDTTAQMLTRWTSTYRGKGYRTVVVLGGINDTIQDIAVATVESNLQTIYDQARADGAKLIVVTVLPWKLNVNWTAGRQTNTDTLNTWIRNYQAAHPSDTTLVDAYALMGDVDPAALKAAWADADNLHPNAAGYKQLAYNIQAALP